MPNLARLVAGGAWPLLLLLAACAHPPPPADASPAAPPETAAAPAPTSEAPLSMAVLPVAAKNVDERVAATLTAVLTSELAAVPGYRVITADDLNATLALERQRELLGCDEASCLAEIGGALGVERLLASTAGAVGDTHVVTLTLIDAKSGRPLGRAYETGRGRADVLLPTLRRAVFRLFDLPGEPPPVVDDGALVSLTPPRSAPQVVSAGGEPLPPATTGGLSITDSTPGVTATISGPRGYVRQVVVPWTGEGLVPGEYKIRLIAPGHVDKELFVRVVAGETRAVLAELTPGAPASVAPPAPVAKAPATPPPAPPRTKTRAPAKAGGTATFVLEEPPEDARGPTTPWLPCRAGQQSTDKGCRGKPGLYTWAEAQHACPPGYRVPMHEELLGVLDCFAGGEPRAEGCRPCAASPACRALFGDDRGSYWTASSMFDNGFVVDLGRGTVARVPKQMAHQVRCARR